MPNERYMTVEAMEASEPVFPYIGKHWRRPRAESDVYHIAMASLMTPIPSDAPIATRATEENMADKFARLADKWEEETKLMSSMNDIVTNQTHLQIVAMGPAVVPFILNRMRRKPGWWFESLRFLTGQDPVPENARGKLRAMTEAWLKWGEENGQV